MVRYKRATVMVMPRNAIDYDLQAANRTRGLKGSAGTVGNTATPERESGKR